MLAQSYSYQPAEPAMRLGVAPKPGSPWIRGNEFCRRYEKQRHCPGAAQSVLFRSVLYSWDVTRTHSCCIRRSRSSTAAEKTANDEVTLAHCHVEPEEQMDNGTSWSEGFGRKAVAHHQIARLRGNRPNGWAFSGSSPGVTQYEDL